MSRRILVLEFSYAAQATSSRCGVTASPSKRLYVQVLCLLAGAGVGALAVRRAFEVLIQRKCTATEAQKFKPLLKQVLWIGLMLSFIAIGSILGLAMSVG